MNTEDILHEAFNKSNIIFLTGPGGTGKTHTINKYMEKYCTNLNVALTASTGIAATHIDGQTIHRMTGTGQQSNLDYIEHLMTQEKKWEIIKNRLSSVDILIIDEISMLRSDTIDLINVVWMYARRCKDKAFGGVKVVLSGDFMQLPPVVTKSERIEDPWAFQSYTWQNSNVLNLGLTKIWRQEDQTFLKILNDLRFGYCSLDSNNILVSRHNSVLKEDPIVLMSTNKEVDERNEQKFKELSGDEKEYFYVSGGKDKKAEELLVKSCLAPNTLRLKENCRVMVLKNHGDEPPDYVNGSLGTVLEFDQDGLPVVELDNGRIIKFKQSEWIVPDGKGRPLAFYKQLPLRLAYAITMHKSQGMTLDNVEIDCKNIFAPGQAYVALSRVKSLDGLRLLNWNRNKAHSDWQAVQFYKNMKNELQ